MASNFWSPVENQLGIQPIQQANAATPSQYQTGQSQEFGQAHPLGKIVRADEIVNSSGEGEFIYLAGVASTRIGSLVTYNPLAGTTTLAPSTAKLNQPLAVSMSVCTAGMFGWYQIGGVSTILKSAVKVSPAVPIYLSGSGRVTSVQASGKEVLNAVTVNAATVASATSTITVLLQRSGAQGQTV